MLGIWFLIGALHRFPPLPFYNYLITFFKISAFYKARRVLIKNQVIKKLLQLVWFTCDLLEAKANCHRGKQDKLGKILINGKKYWGLAKFGFHYIGVIVM